MGVELEAKVKVDSHEPLRERLAAIGATRVGRVLESNHIFDSADRTLLSSGCGLRVRTCRDEAGVPRGATLTFKGPVQPGKLKKREEIETSLDDGEATIAIFKSLGYVEVVCFEKRRETWTLADCTIELDEVPLLGCFVEIEGPDEPAVRGVLEQLRLGSAATITQSYIALLVDYCRARNLPIDQIRFADSPR